jgi:hypothetical protein
MRSRRLINTVVFPEPVGNDTPIRELPESSASMHACRAVSWYDLSKTGCASVLKCREEIVGYLQSRSLYVNGVRDFKLVWRNGAVSSIVS